jgi:hypothetical protein
VKLGLIKSPDPLAAHPHQYLPLLQIYLANLLLVCLKALYPPNFDCSTMVGGMEQASTLVDGIDEQDSVPEIASSEQPLDVRFSIGKVT